MSRENVEIVRRSFEAWERGDLAGVLEMAADWVEDFADHAMKAEDFLDFTLRAGRVTRFDMYASEAGALEAVGARE